MRNRRGFSLLESFAAMVLLAAMLTVSLQFLRALADHRRAVRQREAAVQETANVMERLCAQRWHDLTAETGKQVQLSPQASRVLPGGVLKVEITPSNEKPECKRISVVVSWQDVPGRPNRPARLVAWRYLSANER
jgi:Tfp pilus assembly protein PilV